MFNNIINKVMNSCYEENSEMTLAEAINSHKELYNVKWEKCRAEYIGTYVTFSAEIKNIHNFYSSCINHKQNIIETSSMLTKYLFELIEYRKYMTFYYNAEDIFSYLHTRRESINSPNLLDFDYEKSTIRIYIQFIKDTWKDYKSISSGYTVRLKISKPNLGYFGGLFDDVADGRKCISSIYKGDPITLFGAF